MEHLAMQLDRVTAKYDTADPIDVLHILATEQPDILSINTTYQMNSTGEPTLYTCAISIRYRTTYVASSDTLQGAVQAVCGTVYEQLKERQSRLKSTINNDDYENTNNIVSPQSLIDGELKKIIQTFETCGYTVTMQDCGLVYPEGNLLYRYLFKVPGFGEFIASSDDVFRVAFTEAAEQFKGAFYEEFCLKQIGAKRCIEELNRSPVVQQQQQPKMMAKGVLELIDFESSSGQEDEQSMPPPRDLLSAEVETATLKAPRLLMCDFMWIELINRFIEANRPDRTYSDVIQELIAAELIRYTVSDESHVKRKCLVRFPFAPRKALFKTTVHLVNVSIASAEVSVEKSKDRIFRKVYNRLCWLVSLLRAIKDDLSTDRSPFELMEEVKTKCPDFTDFRQLLNVYTKTHFGSDQTRECPIKMVSLRLLEDMFKYVAYADTLLEAEFVAYSAFFGYLKVLVEYTVKKPPSGVESTPVATMNPTDVSSSSSVDYNSSGSKSAATSGYRSTYAEWIGPVSDETLVQAIQTLTWTDAPPLRLRTFDINDAVAKLDSLGCLIWNFHEVYDPTETPMEIAEKLIDRCSGKLQLTNEFDTERQYYICRLRSAELGLLMGVSTVEADEARTKVLTQLFAMLHQYAMLVSTYRLFRSSNRAPEHYLSDYLLLNADLISIRSWPVNLNCFKTLITVECLHVSFQDTGNSNDESQARAFEHFVAFMDRFTAPIDNCIDINKPLHQETVSLLGRNAYRRPVPLLKRGAEEGALVKTMVMLLRFEQICKLETTGSNSNSTSSRRSAVITRLMVTFPGEIKITTTRERTSNNRGHTVRRYKSVITAAQLGSFTHLSLVSRTEAHNGAFSMLWMRLYQLNKLVRKVLKLNTTDMTAIDKVFMTETTLIDTFVFPRQKIVQVRVTNIGKFISTGETLDDARLLAFNQMVFSIRQARQQALEVIGQLENEQLEVFKVKAALSDAETGEVLDSSMAARIKLVKDFKSVFFDFKTASSIIEEMASKTASIGFIVTKQVPSAGSDITVSIDVTDVGEFWCCAKEWNLAYEEAALKLFQFTRRLLFLLESFQAVYTPLKTAAEVLEELLPMGTNKQLIQIKQIPGTELTTTEDTSSLCLIELARMRSFGRLGPNKEAAKQEAAISAVDYLKRLALGVLGPAQF